MVNIVNDVYNTRQLLNGDNMEIILKDAITQGWIQNIDGTPIDIKDVSDDARYELMGLFIQFLLDTDQELESRFIIAKA
jgi:hypothetical protein|tara:strand:+ start:561 stop:797 length:237 start_codon:yes stop_codon:yes gene_type:complete